MAAGWRRFGLLLLLAASCAVINGFQQFHRAPLSIPAPAHAAAVAAAARRSTMRMQQLSASPLAGRVALVTGASRGIGRGIAYELAAAGATVYATARSTGVGDCTEAALGGTLAELAQEVASIGTTGGQVRPLKCDHARDEEVYGAVDTIKREQGGRLDLLVNNAFQIAAVDTMTGKPFWEQGAAVWDPLMQVGLRSHYVAACAAAPLLVETAARKQAPAAPAVINIGSFGGVSYVFNVAYGVGKAGVNRLSKDMAIELRPKGVACFSCWPGVVMTERMASIKAKDEEKWRTVMGVGEGYVESPRFTGRAIVALLSSPGVDLLQRSGSVQIVAELAREFGFEDVSGARPPSIRSLQFLLPNYALKGVFEAAPFLTKAVPDWRLPLSVMGQRPD